MTTTPEILDLHAVPHPIAAVRRAGFPLDHPYLEHCWAPIIGPSSVLLLRRCSWLWRDANPARVPTQELARQLGLGNGSARNSPVWHTVERVVRFRFAEMAAPSELEVYTEVPPVPQRQLDRLPSWCRTEHERLLGDHLDSLARSASSTTLPVPEYGPPAHTRMAQHLERLTNHAANSAPTLHR